MIWISFSCEYQKGKRNIDEENVAVIKNKLSKYVVVFEWYTEPRLFYYVIYRLVKYSKLPRPLYRESASKEDFCEQA